MQNLLRFLSDVRVAAAASFIAGLITEAVFALWYDVFGLLLGGYDEAVRQQHLAFGLVGIVGGIIACPSFSSKARKLPPSMSLGRVCL